MKKQILTSAILAFLLIAFMFYASVKEKETKELELEKKMLTAEADHLRSILISLSKEQ